MKYAIFVLALLLAGCGAKNGEPAPVVQQKFVWTDTNAAPYASAIFNTWIGADQVCFSLNEKGEGLYLVHFSVTEDEEEFRNKWWLMTSYEFVTLDNGSYILKKGNVNGDFVSTPTVDNLICKKK